jgi:ferrous iron transport protein B
MKSAVLRVALLGNINVGKSVIFNRLCGRRTREANYPGTSVLVGRGTFLEGGAVVELIDTPGITSLRPESEDETISRDILLREPLDAVGHVVDGKNLRKGLLLASELHAYGIPTVVNINMMDEVHGRGIRIDRGRLADVLGVEVTQTIATEGEGLGAFRSALVRARKPEPLVRFQPHIEEGLERIEALLRESRGPASRGLASLLLSGDAAVRAFVREQAGEDDVRRIDEIRESVQLTFAVPVAIVMARTRAEWVDRVLGEVMEVHPPARLPFAEKLGSWCRRPLTGVPIAILLLFLVYLFVGKLGGELLVELFEGKLFGELLIPGLESLLAPLGSPFLTEMFVGKFGLVSLGLALDLGIVLPVLLTFFIAFGLLEESGYVPSLSILLDRAMKRIGLTGRGVLPLVLGFSCITMAVLSTRTLEKRKERILATLLLVLGIPCAPLLGVMLAVMAPLSVWAPVVLFGVVLAQILLVGLVAQKLIPGERSDFIMELPPLRLPRIGNIVHRAFYRSRRFVIEAVPLFLLGSFVLFLLDQAGLLAAIQKGTKPVVSGLLGLPSEATEAFIMTLVRREAGAAYLKELVDGGLLAGRHIVVALLVMTTFSPCVNAALVIWKDLGIRVALGIHLFVIPWAIAVGTLTNFVLVAVGANF